MVGDAGLEPATSSMKSLSGFSRYGGRNRFRTCDLPDVSRVLYQLSYPTIATQAKRSASVASSLSAQTCGSTPYRMYYLANRPS